MILQLPNRTIEFPRRPLLMGIININDDSFSGDGTLDPDLAVAHARQLIADGADIIDIGAESARTNRGPISVEEEIHPSIPGGLKSPKRFSPTTSISSMTCPLSRTIAMPASVPSTMSPFSSCTPSAFLRKTIPTKAGPTLWPR